MRTRTHRGTRRERTAADTPRREAGEEPALPTPGSRPPASRTGRPSAVQATGSVVPGDGAQATDTVAAAKSPSESSPVAATPPHGTVTEVSGAAGGSDAEEIRPPSSAGQTGLCWHGLAKGRCPGPPTPRAS